MAQKKKRMVNNNFKLSKSILVWNLILQFNIKSMFHGQNAVSIHGLVIIILIIIIIVIIMYI